MNSDNESIQQPQSFQQKPISCFKSLKQHMLLAIVIFVAVLAGACGYLLGANRNQSYQQTTKRLTSIKTSAPTNSDQNTQAATLEQRPTFNIYPTTELTDTPTPTVLPIPKDFIWKTFNLNDPDFGMNFEYPSFWNLKEYSGKLDYIDQKYKNTFKIINEADGIDKYGYLNAIEIISFDAVRDNVNNDPTALESLLNVYKTRSLNGLVIGVHGKEFYPPLEEDYTSSSVPIDTRYIENKDGSLRGYSYFGFGTQNGLADHIEHDRLFIILTDGKNKIVQIKIINFNNDMPFDNYGDKFTKPSDFHFENTQPLPCNAGINDLTSHTVKCYINKEFYSDYDRIYKHVAESIILH